MDVAGREFSTTSTGRLWRSPSPRPSVIGGESTDQGCDMRPYDLTLDEMLADPMVRQLMDRDGVAEAQVRRLSEHVRRRRGPGLGPTSGSGFAVRYDVVAPEPQNFAD